jgi:hypothetical protein
MGHGLAEQHFSISKKFENDSKNVLPQNKNSFSGELFITYLKDGQSV